MATYLGVDGGGSKTHLVLVNDAGQVVAEARTESCYYLGGNIELVGRILQDGIARITRASGVDAIAIDQAFFGLPGYGEVSADIPRLDRLPATVLGHDRFTVDNDMVCGWAGSLGAADGINVISGTGSMTYGERAGRGHRVGGWSELFGDEGSGYWIAVRGLNAFTKMSDGRLPRGPLYDMVKERVAIRSDLDLIDVVMNSWRRQRVDIAALSTTVVEAAAHGDAVAADILSDACGELIEIVDATRRALDFAAEDVVPVSYSGGVFSAEPIVSGFTELLGAKMAHYDLRQPLFDPGVGAALYAAKIAGTPLDDRAVAALRSR